MCLFSFLCFALLLAKLPFALWFVFVSLFFLSFCVHIVDDIMICTAKLRNTEQNDSKREKRLVVVFFLQWRQKCCFSTMKCIDWERIRLHMNWSNSLRKCWVEFKSSYRFDLDEKMKIKSFGICVFCCDHITSTNPTFPYWIVYATALWLFFIFAVSLYFFIVSLRHCCLLMEREREKEVKKPNLVVWDVLP